MKGNPEYYISALGFHIPALDGVRGWAIMLVILNHCVMLFPHKGTMGFFAGKVFKYFGMGWMGVDLFFVLSGFLITGILLRTRDDGNFFVNFYARRTLRIFPLYYLTISLFLFGGPLVIDNFNRIYTATIPFHKLIYFFYAQNFLAIKFDLNSIPQLLLDPMWSLAVEEHFYLLWPAVVYFCRKHLLEASLAGILASIVIRISFLRYGSPLAGVVYTCTLTRMDSILVGSLIAIALHDHDLRHLFNKYKWPAFYASLAAFILMHVFVKLTKINCVETIGYTLFAFLFGSIINLILFLPKKRGLVRIFDNAPFRCFGKYSYSMYLFHMPAILLVRRFVINSLDGNALNLLFIMIACSTSLTLITAFVTWNCYEKFFLNLKDYFTSEKETMRVGQAAKALPVSQEN